MWIGLPFAFLMPAIRPPKTVKPGDDRTMQIRSRRGSDLDILRASFMPGKLGPTLHTPGMDYEYRAYCTPESFAFAIAKMIEAIDYTKFKPQCHRYEDDELHSFYNRVWSVYSAAFSPKHWQPAPGPKKTYLAPTATGVTLAKPATGTVLGPVGWVDYADYHGSALTDYALPAATASRSGYRGRDGELEPDEDQVLSSGDKVLDDLYARIDTLEFFVNDWQPTSHKECEHGGSDAAKARCRRRRRRADEEELERLREQLAERYRELYKEDFAAVAESDDLITVGVSESVEAK